MRFRKKLKVVIGIIPFLIAASEANALTPQLPGRVEYTGEENPANGPGESRITGYWNVRYNNESGALSSGQQFMQIVYVRTPGGTPYVWIFARAKPIADPTASELYWSCYVTAASPRTSIQSDFEHFKRAALNASAGNLVSVKKSGNICQDINFHMNIMFQH